MRVCVCVSCSWEWIAKYATMVQAYDVNEVKQDSMKLIIGAVCFVGAICLLQLWICAR